jgi:hypothetical protein
MANRRPALFLQPASAFFILLKAREFDAKVEEVDPDEGSNPADDKMIDVLEFQADDAVEEELVSAIQGLDEDERLDLIALIWIGRGDFTLDQWSDARESAQRIDPLGVADYVLGLPMASDYLEEGLSQFGHSLGQFLDSGFMATGELPVAD